MKLYAQRLALSFLLLATLFATSSAAGIDSILFNKGLKVVVIGVSKYRDTHSISPLLYADADARAFVSLLEQNCGVQDSDITFLANDSAITASYKPVFDNIMGNTSDSYTLLFYFAGHGIENTALRDPQKPLKQDYYLLLHDAIYNMDQSSTRRGHINFNDILTSAQSWSKYKKVILVVDACRSVDDTVRSVPMSPTTRYNESNVYKFLACNAGQSSHESCTWGGGHGMFSYYLMKGLSGEADASPRNGIITTYELKEYMHDSIRKNADQVQTPDITYGDEDLLPCIRIDTALKMFKDTLTNRGCGTEEPRRFQKSRRGFSFDSKLPAQPPYDINQFEKAVTLGKLCAERSDAISVAKYPITIDSMRVINMDKSGRPLTMAAFSPDGKWLALSGKAQQRVFMIDAIHYKTVKIFEKVNSEIKGLAFSPDSKFMLSWSNNDQIEVYDLNTLQKPVRFSVPTLPDDIAADPVSATFCGTNIITTYSNGTIYVHDVKGTQLNRRKEPFRIIASGLIDKSRLAVTDGAAIYTVRTNTLRRTGRSQSTPSEIKTIFANAYDKDIFYLDKKSRLSIMGRNSAADERNQIVIPSASFSVSFSPQGYSPLLISDSNLYVYTDNGLKVLENADSIKSLDVAYNPLNFDFISTDQKGNICVWYFKNDQVDAASILDTIIKSSSEAQYAPLLIQKYSYQLIDYAQNIIDKALTEGDNHPSVQNIERAISYLRKAMTLSAYDSVFDSEVRCQILFLESYRLYEMNDYDSFDVAKRKVSEALALNPKAVYPILMEGRIDQKLNRLREAALTSDSCIALIPRWSVPKELLGRIDENMAKYGEAEKQYAIVVKDYPKNVAGYLALGDEKAGLGFFDEAASFYNQAMTADCNDPTVYAHYGSLQLQRGRYKEAEFFLNKSTALDSNYYYGYKVKADLSDAQNSMDNESDFARTLRLYDKSLSKSPYEAMTYVAMGNFINKVQSLNRESGDQGHFFEDNHMDDARIQNLFDHVMKYAPYSADATAAYASYLYFFKRNSDAGRKAFQHYIDSFPLSALAQCRYGAFLSLINDSSEAKVALKKALALDNKCLNAYKELLGIYVKEKNESNMLSLLDSSRKNLPANPVIPFEVSSYEYETGNYRQAVQLLVEALSKDKYYQQAIDAWEKYEDNVNTASILIDVSQKKWGGQRSFTYTKVLVNNNVLFSSDSLFYIAGSDMTIKKMLAVYRDVIPHEAGLEVVSLKEKRGWLDLDGNEIVPPKYEVITQLDGALKVRGGEQWGVYSFEPSEGMIIPLKYDNIESHLLDTTFANILRVCGIEVNVEGSNIFYCCSLAKKTHIYDDKGKCRNCD